MAWIESHQELGQHPKTKRLARRLGTSLPAVVGHLQYLWWWALDYADDGDLSAYENEDLADAAMWDGDPDEFANALIECGPGGQEGFIERVDDRIFLHDWWDYAGALLESRAASAEAGARGNHERWHVRRGITDPECPYCGEFSGDESPGESGGESGSDRVLSHPTVPNRTVPNQTEPRDNTSSLPPYQEIVDLYHSTCPSLPKVVKLTDQRRALLRSRWKEYKTLSVFRDLFEKAEKSDFLSGRNGQWTACNLEWLIRPNNMPKVLEGTYNRERGSPNGKRRESAATRRLRKAGELP